MYGEFFYSAVDRQLFLDENEFAQIFSDLFPNLKTTKLRLAEWQEVRRLVGRPRRLSQDFLNEERKALAARRRKIRAIYNGTCMTLAADHDLPKKLPRQPVVGMKVYARIRAPKDGVYAGTIDAILNEGYRVQFEKQEVIPTSVVHVSFSSFSNAIFILCLFAGHRGYDREPARIALNQLFSRDEFCVQQVCSRAEPQQADFCHRSAQIAARQHDKLAKSTADLHFSIAIAFR